MYSRPHEHLLSDSKSVICNAGTHVQRTATEVLVGSRSMHLGMYCYTAGHTRFCLLIAELFFSRAR